MKIIASDFDGVICNGLKEYFYTSKLVYQQLWQEREFNLDSLENDFYLLRPVIETGWEMPLLLKALTLGEKSENILQNWVNVREKVLKMIIKDGIDKNILIQKLDQIRQEQIKHNFESWLNLHSFYEGIISKFKNIIEREIKVYIITTKSAEFTSKLLEMQGIKLATSQIIGKEIKQPKYQTLKDIITQEKVNPEEVAFIEDRLEALELVYQQPDLQNIQLFFALWGYNTELDKSKCQEKSYIRPLSLTEFIHNGIF